MDFSDLNAFYYVAKQENYSRAAAELRIAQSALSRRVARLEHQLGVKLFARSGRCVTLTEEGAALFERAQGLMHEVRAIEDDLLSLAREPSGTVTVALPPTTGHVLGPLIVADCRERNPRINIKIREGISGFIHDWLAADQVDIALLYYPELNSNYKYVTLLREPLFLIAPIKEKRNLELKTKFNFSDISKLPLILPGSSHSMRRLLERLAADRGISLHVVNQVDGMVTTVGMVEAGLGYTIFSYAGVYKEINAAKVEAIPIEPEISWDLALAQRKSTRTLRAMTEVRKSILRQVERLVAGKLWRGKIMNNIPA